MTEEEKWDLLKLAEQYMSVVYMFYYGDNSDNKSEEVLWRFDKGVIINFATHLIAAKKHIINKHDINLLQKLLNIILRDKPNPNRDDMLITEDNDVRILFNNLYIDVKNKERKAIIDCIFSFSEDLLEFAKEHKDELQTNSLDEALRKLQGYIDPDFLQTDKCRRFIEGLFNLVKNNNMKYKDYAIITYQLYSKYRNEQQRNIPFYEFYNTICNTIGIKTSPSYTKPSRVAEIDTTSQHINFTEIY